MARTGKQRRVPLARPLIEARLDSGRMIYAVQLHIGFTYGTYTKVFLESDRIYEINLELLWNEYPAKVLWNREFPSTLLRRHEIQNSGRPSLPIYKFTALFESEPLRARSARHSALVLNWLQDVAEPLISAENEADLASLPWEQVARDFK